MNEHLHVQDARRKNIRWRILSVCDTSRGVSVDEGLMLGVLSDVDLNVTPSELRREAAFLEKKDLLEVKKDNGRWRFGITADGTEIVEYDAPCPRSIGRPVKYY